MATEDNINDNDVDDSCHERSKKGQFLSVSSYATNKIITYMDCLEQDMHIATLTSFLCPTSSQRRVYTVKMYMYVLSNCYIYVLLHDEPHCWQPRASSMDVSWLFTPLPPYPLDTNNVTSQTGSVPVPCSTAPSAGKCSLWFRFPLDAHHDAIR